MSAFQIRFGGFKGVVSIDPNLVGKQLQFRKSMKKFESGYNRLDVLNLAEYIPCFLNRQVIVILSSLGVEDKAFSDLLDQSLKTINCLLINNQVASDFLIQYYRPIVSSTSINTFNLNYTFEPFFRDLLKTIQQKMLTDLLKKSRIFVPKGRILMGTIDETRTLKENEVFIQCKYGLLDTPNSFEGTINDKFAKTFIVNSKIAVAKNPCMHPGDIRTLTAVNNHALHHMFDCIVFPSVGNRPITNMCSGSDLDGDLYLVTWEPSLIPVMQEEPMDYGSGKAKEETEPISINQVIEFFVNFIKVDQLGRIANAHVAISDSSMRGVKDPMCLKLAKIFSQAVDFPKTGFVAEIPSEIQKLQYPDFMEKKGTWYFSQKIIGKMYRKCKQISTGEFDFDKVG